MNKIFSTSLIRFMKDTVVNYVSKLRSKKNITQEELAKIIGVTRQTIIAIEKGNYTPSVVLAIKIARFFNTPLEEVFTLS